MFLKITWTNWVAIAGFHSASTKNVVCSQSVSNHRELQTTSEVESTCMATRFIAQTELAKDKRTRAMSFHYAHHTSWITSVSSNGEQSPCFLLLLLFFCVRYISTTAISTRSFYIIASRSFYCLLFARIYQKTANPSSLISQEVSCNHQWYPLLRSFDFLFSFLRVFSHYISILYWFLFLRIYQKTVNPSSLIPQAVSYNHLKSTFNFPTIFCFLLTQFTTQC